MLCYLRVKLRDLPFNVARWASLALLVTIGAVWLWAHEGHEPLPTRGARTVKDKDGRVTGVVLSREAREAVGLRTAVVGKRRVDERVLAYASLVAPWQGHAFATSRLPGRIEKLHVRPGDEVKAGQVLADVRSVELEALQLELLTARTDSRLSAKLLASLTESYERGATAEQSLLDARVKHRQDQNALEIARAKWKSLGLPRGGLDRLLRDGKPAVSTLPVLAPIGGTVIHADLGVGKVIEPAEHLFEIVDLSAVWVRIGVLERDLHRVKVGMEVELSLAAYPGEAFRAKVDVKGHHLDPTAHLNTVWAELKNPDGSEPRFYPGMSGQAHLLVAEEPGTEAARARPLAQAAAAVAFPSPALGPALSALAVAALGLPAPASTVVPAGALIHDGLEHYVLVEGADTPEGSEYVRVPVVVGRREGDWVEVLGGDVFPGGHVVTRGSHQLASFFVPGVLRLSPEGLRGAGLLVERPGPRGAELVLQVEQAGKHRVDSALAVEGAVEVPPHRRATVSAQLAGTLDWVGVERDQEVKAGQEVARIASLELQSMQLDLLKANLELGLVKDTLGRLRQAKASMPPRLVWEVESRQNTLKHQRDAMRRKLNALGLSDGQLKALEEKKELVGALPVRSTIAGRLLRFDKVLGQAVKADEGLFEVHDLSDPLIQAFVGEADLAHVRPGQKARVRLTADPSFVGEATVARSGRVFGAESRVLSVWAKLDRPPPRPLLHNQLARLTLVRGQAAYGVAVPLAAVVYDGARPFVFVRQKDGTFDRRSVETGAADDRRVLVTRGLADGETVAAAGAAALQTAFASVR